MSMMVVDEPGTPSSTLVLPERASPVPLAPIALIAPHLVRHDGFGRIPIDPRWALPMRDVAAAVAAGKVPFGVLPFGAARLHAA